MKNLASQHLQKYSTEADRSHPILVDCTARGGELNISRRQRAVKFCLWQVRLSEQSCQKVNY